MSALLPYLQKIIEEDGPISLDRYMRICLTDPQNGYYTTKQAIGREGDFITAPEVSQLFGEMIGVWLVDIWQKMGCPKPFHILEAGPGRGTLMADQVRCFLKLAPNAKSFLHLHLIEKSPVLKKKQEKALNRFHLPITWHEDLNVPQGENFVLVANEFLDALPIKQFQYQAGRWYEKMIGLDDENALSYGLIPCPSPRNLPLNPQEGDIFEVSPDSQQFIASLCDSMKDIQAACLFIDYGHLKSAFGDTFQAVKQHDYIHPLEATGEADLTAHVDFDPLARIADQNNVQSFTTTQGDFLINMGILERAGRLGASLSSEKQQQIRQDVERLAHPDHMGSLFKVMALTTNKVVPHGF